jgi:hypothetical protein
MKYPAQGEIVQYLPLGISFFQWFGWLIVLMPILLRLVPAFPFLVAKRVGRIRVMPARGPPVILAASLLLTPIFNGGLTSPRFSSL